MNDQAIKQQEDYVLWGYVIQWCMLIIPPAAIASFVYVLVMRSKVPHAGLRSHLSWQFATLVQILVLGLIAIALFAIGMSGVGTDAPVSILATFLVVGGSLLFVPWLLYRLLRGTIQFRAEQPMQSLFP